MKEEIRYTYEKFNDALNRLKEGSAQAKDELDKDGVIQRFEFTFELLWKNLRIFLENEGIECRTPKECLKSAFTIGLIQDEEMFLDMLDDRNKSSHIYSREESEKTFVRIKNNYVPHLKKVSRKLREWKP